MSKSYHIDPSDFRRMLLQQERADDPATPSGTDSRQEPSAKLLPLPPRNSSLNAKVPLAEAPDNQSSSARLSANDADEVAASHSLWYRVVRFFRSDASPQSRLGRLRPVDLRLRQRPERLPFFSVLLSGSERLFGPRTQIAQEARLIYCLIIVAFFVDLLVWMALINAWLGAYLSDAVASNVATASADSIPLIEFSSKALTNILSYVKNLTHRFNLRDLFSLLIAGVICYGFALYELIFYRADVSKQSPRSSFEVELRSLMSTPYGRIFVSAAFGIGLAVVTAVIATVTNPIVIIAVSVVAPLLIISYLRFGLSATLTVAVRIVIIIAAALATSQPIELVLHSRTVAERHIAAKKHEIQQHMRSTFDRLKEQKFNDKCPGLEPPQTIRERLAQANEAYSCLLECEKREQEDALREKLGCGSKFHGELDIGGLCDPRKTAGEGRMTKRIRAKLRSLETLVAGLEAKLKKADSQYARCMSEQAAKDEMLFLHLKSEAEKSKDFTNFTVSSCATAHPLLRGASPPLCIEPPDFFEQISALTEIPDCAAKRRVQLMAMFLALVMPIIVILGKLLASNELIDALGRRSEWMASIGYQDPDTLVRIVLSQDRPTDERQNALRLLHLYGLLDDRIVQLVNAMQDAKEFEPVLRKLGRLH